MTDLAKLAALDDQIVGADQDDLDAIELLLEQRTLLLEEPLEPPATEEPPPAEPQVEPPKDGIDPLESIRGLTAKQIDKKMNVGPMRKMIEAVTGERPSSKLRAPELADQLYKLTISDQIGSRP